MQEEKEEKKNGSNGKGEESFQFCWKTEKVIKVMMESRGLFAGKLEGV